MVKKIALILLIICQLQVAQGNAFYDSVRRGIEQDRQDRLIRRQKIEEANRERAILYGILLASGFKAEVLKKCSLNELRARNAFVKKIESNRLYSVGGKGTTELQKARKAIEDKKLAELQKVKDDRFAFINALKVEKADRGKRVEIYVTLGGADLEHIKTLLNLDKVDRESKE